MYPLDGKFYGHKSAGYCGVEAIVSKDSGNTWENPILLIDFGKYTDGTYPSAVQLDDGTIVIFYYSTSYPKNINKKQEFMSLF